MNRDEARIVLLEQALDQAIHTIEFMHGCLTEEGYVYAYPEQTEVKLAKFRKLVSIGPMCVHSFDARKRGIECAGCEAREKYFLARAEAERILNEYSQNL